MNYSLHPEADEEFAEAIRHYSEISPGLGKRFFFELERLLREACAHPKHCWKFDPPARGHSGKEFPYWIIFIEKPDDIWVVAVMHTNRRPGYWRKRLG